MAGLVGNSCFTVPLASFRPCKSAGVVDGEQWIYDYIGWLVLVWSNSDSILQQTAIAGSAVRTVSHSSGGGVVPASVVASFYAIQEL